MNFEAIAHINTCYGEKFGVPRQPGLVDEAWGKLIFEPEFRTADAVRGLEGFSHVWLVFVFHQSIKKNWKPTVRPPRLGGNDRVGVFASRSPFRPNPLGLSCVRLDSIDLEAPDGPILNLRGIDLVDGTPILDIKPYIPYSDSIPDAQAGFAPSPPSSLEVIWEKDIANTLDPSTLQLITSTLSIDPRPAYQEDPLREYGCLISGYNVRWRVEDRVIHVFYCA